MRKPRILLLARDLTIWDSLASLLRLHAAEVVASVPGDRVPIDLVVVVCDSWPEQWRPRSLRAMFPRTPCLLLSGSPTSGPYTASTFARGFFTPLPVTASRLMERVTSLLE